MTHSHSEEGSEASSWGGVSAGLGGSPGALRLPASRNPAPPGGSPRSPSTQRLLGPTGAAGLHAAEPGLDPGGASPTRGPGSGSASPLPQLGPCFLPCVGVHLPEAESPRHWCLGAGAGGGGSMRGSRAHAACAHRSPASATASSPRRASGPSTRRRGARPCSRSRSSSRWTSHTRRVELRRRRMAFTRSRSRSCLVSCWGGPGPRPGAGSPPALPLTCPVSPRPEPPLQEGRGDHSGPAAEHTRAALCPALVR